MSEVSCPKSLHTGPEIRAERVKCGANICVDADNSSCPTVHTALDGQTPVKTPVGRFLDKTRCSLENSFKHCLLE